MKNKSIHIIGNSNKINDNLSNEKSKFKSTLDVDSYNSHKFKNDNIVSSDSFKEISNNEKNKPLKGLLTFKSFCNDEESYNSYNEIIDKRTIKNTINFVDSPIRKNINYSLELEKEKLHNVIIENSETKINLDHVINNITCFDTEKEKHSKRKDLIFKDDEKDNLIQLKLEEKESDISHKTVYLVNYMQVLYDQNSERLKKRSQQMKKMKEKLNINETNNFKELPKKKGHSDTNLVPFCAKVFLEIEENQKESILESINNNIKDLKNDIELVISDLDCPIEEDNTKKTDTIDDKINISKNKPSLKSFVPLTNNLLLKSHARQDNATCDYLLALKQCETKDENMNKSENISEIDNQTHKRLPSVIIFLKKSLITLQLMKS